jgi:hypothetical protein
VRLFSESRHRPNSGGWWDAGPGPGPDAVRPKQRNAAANAAPQQRTASLINEMDALLPSLLPSDALVSEYLSCVGDERILVERLAVLNDEKFRIAEEQERSLRFNIPLDKKTVRPDRLATTLTLQFWMWWIDG